MDCGTRSDSTAQIQVMYWQSWRYVIEEHIGVEEEANATRWKWPGSPGRSDVYSINFPDDTSSSVSFFSRLLATAFSALLTARFPRVPSSSHRYSSCTACPLLSNSDCGTWPKMPRPSAVCSSPALPLFSFTRPPLLLFQPSCLRMCVCVSTCVFS